MSNALVEALLRIAGEAAALVNTIYQSPFRVEYKGPNDPVTLADRAANDLICREIAAEFPGVPIVAEESDPASFSDFRRADRVFFVDPVDGTQEFVRRNGQFVVMIGMLDGERPKAGIVHAPALGTVWCGMVGQGAFRIDPGGDRRQISVSRAGELARATVVGSRAHRTRGVERALVALNAGHLEAVGSAGLKGVWVAEGRADAYVAPFHAGWRWDACAIEAVVAAAGGRLTDAYGEPLDYRGASLENQRGVVASNGLIHPAIVKRLTEFRAAGEV
ncbi:MAG TPA: 3'(2'),5'-bisphosphate nucleotidase CysQ [Polyangiaceae bacterium]|jgi:3'(2'), 5'-bisphosphate nucleotidase